MNSGEQAGALETLLDKIATYKEKTESMKAKIKKAITYPAAVVVIAFIVSTILLVKVVPTFQELFQGFGADLPAFTQMVINLSEVFQKWWWAIFGVIGFPVRQLADQAAKEGIDDLRKSGLKKVRAGIIGLEELNRVTKD